MKRDRGCQQEGDCLTCLETQINRVSVQLKWQIKGMALMADGA